MTRTGEIGPSERERDASRLDEKLPPCWIRTSAPEPQAVFEPASALTPSVLKEVLGDGDSACLALSSRPSVVARRLLSACIELDLRTYVHAPSFGSTEEERRLLEKTPQLLVRTGASLDCDLLVGERGQAAIVLLHAPGAPDIGWLRLEGHVAQSAFRLFLQAFWSAPQEALAGATFKRSLDASFDLPPLDSRHFLVSSEVPARSKADVTVAYATADLKTFQVGSSTTVLAPIVPTFAFVDGLRTKAGAIRSDEAVRLPPLSVGPEFFSMVIGTGQGGLPLVLDLPPAKAPSKAVLAVAAGARSRFEAAALVRDADGEVLVEGASFRRPPDEVLVDAGVARAATFDDMDSASPAIFPAPDPLSKWARWRWRVLPPARPKKATPAKLVGAWNVFDEWAAKRAGRLKSDIEAIEADRSALEKQFAGFKSFFLGATRTTTSLLKRLDVILADTPSAHGSARAHEVRTELGEVAAEARRLAEDKTSTRRAELEKQQRAEHERRVSEAKAKLAEETPRRAELEAELAALREGLAEAEKAPQDTPDVKAALKKLKSDRHQAEQRLGGVNRRVSELEVAAGAEFVFQEEARSTLPKSKQTFAFAPAQEASAPPIPSEDLPSVGTLHEHGSERFLEIALWEQVVQGGREATRLVARLVGPPEGT